jgi:uncharacterized protein
MPIERATRADDRCILLFVKYPHDGLVKQRLAADLPGIRVTELYRNFVLDLLSTLKALRVPVHICYYPENMEQECVEWLGKKYVYLPQTGADLGERMRNAFSRTFLQGYRRAVLLGSDVPDLPARIVRKALLVLTKRDAVLGPCPDGGYYLIGFRNQAFVPDVFRGMEWSTATVLRETMKSLTREGRTMSLLPEWGDVDTLADLHALVGRAKTSPFRGSCTMSFLRSCNFPVRAV